MSPCQAMARLQDFPETPQLASGPDARRLFAGLAEEPVEVLVLAYLARDQRVLGLRHIRSAAIDRLDVPIRTIAGDALAFDAAAAVMAHNHPSGDPTPSAADREATRRIARALEAIEVRLIDHLVIARGGVTSFRALGLL